MVATRSELPGDTRDLNHQTPAGWGPCLMLRSVAWKKYDWILWIYGRYNALYGSWVFSKPTELGGTTLWWSADILFDFVIHRNGKNGIAILSISCSFLDETSAFIWLVVWLDINLAFSQKYWECHHPNWLIFLRGVAKNHQPAMCSNPNCWCNPETDAAWHRTWSMGGFSTEQRLVRC